MNQETPRTAIACARRIHALEMAADERREHLRREVAGLATTLRAASGGLAFGRKLASAFSSPVGGLGGALRLLFSRSSENRPGRPKFPWKSLLGAAVSCAGIYRWWQARRRM